jgi:hypothetical protein
MNTQELQLLKKAVIFIDDFIAIKPACEIIGLSFKSQHDSIKNDQILGQLSTLNTTVGADFKDREMFCLPKHAFLMWIYRLQPGRILDDTCRENLIKMQKVVHEYLYQGEKNAKQLERHILRINNILTDQSNLRFELSAGGRRLKALNKELAKLLATDPYQNELPFDETPAIDYKPVN